LRHGRLQQRCRRQRTTELCFQVFYHNLLFLVGGGV
jgi:hypothetical protein